MSEARVRVSLTEGLIEFEGPESFVAGLVEKFTGVIQMALAGEPPEKPAADVDRRSDVAGDTHPTLAADHVVSAPTAPEVALNDILAATDTGVQILRAIPGTSNAVRSVNVAKLYLYGLQALKQRDTALFAEIGRACKAHGCFDSNNMAAYLKGDRTSFVFGGKGKRQTLKLSAPGIEGTVALIARLRAEGNGIGSRAKGIARHSIRSAHYARERMPESPP